MGWFHTFIVFQCTIILLHGRPDATTPTTPNDKISIEIEHPASVAAIVASLEQGNPSPPAIETKKHLTANVAVAAPSQLSKRVLVTSLPKKKEQTKAATSTTAAAAATPTTTPSTATTKANRYNDSKNVDLDESSKIETNRQYLPNVYTLNPYFTTPAPQPPPLYQTNQWQYAPILAQLTTPKPIQTIYAPSIQPGPFLVSPNDLYANQNVLNLNANDIEMYEFQLERPIQSGPVVHISQRPEYSTPSLLHLTRNITKLYSVVSSTPDPYYHFQKLQTKPSLTKRKVLKLSVTTRRPDRYDTDDCNGNCLDGNNNNRVTNNPDRNKNYGNNNGWNGNNNDNYNSLNVQYNESSQYFSNFNNPNSYNTNGQFNNNNFNNRLPINHTKECLITSNASNPQTENVCNTNDLKIIIKFDAPNATKTKDNTLKQRKRLTTTTTTTQTPFFYSDNSENSDDEGDDDYEFGGIFEPIQNVFGFLPADRAQRKRPAKPEHGGSHKPPDSVNKYQTIILQTPPPPSTPATKHHSKHSLFKKFLYLMPILAILKPIGFGIWTLVLSPILVIAIGGIALGVVLYPFLTISREQVAYASLSSHRAPKIVVHRHPRPVIKSQKPIMPIYRKPSPAAASSPFIKRRIFNEGNRRRLPNRIVYSDGRRWRPASLMRRRTFHRRSKRRAQDANFQQWLLVQNNFNVRVMSFNDGDFYDDDY